MSMSLCNWRMHEDWDCIMMGTQSDYKIKLLIDSYSSYKGDLGMSLIPSTSTGLYTKLLWCCVISSVFIYIIIITRNDYLV